MNRFEIGGVKFIMAHERVDIPSVLKDIQVVIFGHSHMYYQQEISGRLWLNPGSCGYKRFTLPLSMAVMTIEDGTYEVGDRLAGTRVRDARSSHQPEGKGQSQ